MPTMPSFKVDTSTAVIVLMVPPTEKINRQTGEILTDRDTGAKEKIEALGLPYHYLYGLADLGLV